MLRFFREQKCGLCHEMKKNRMQARNTVEEVLCLNVQRGYTVFLRTKAHRSNVLAKLTEMIKDEEGASQFINGSWHKLLNEIDEAEYLRNLNVLKMKCLMRRVIPILKNITNNISHFALKICVEIKRAPEIIDDPINNCKHYLRKSHGLPCSCELITRFEHLLPLYDIPSAQARDINSEIRDLTSMLDQIITGPISKVREVRHIIKGIQPRRDDGRRTQPKGTKLYWEHVTLAHRKIGKSSGFRSGSCSGSGSDYGSGSRGRDRPPQVSRGRGRGHCSGQSSLSSVIDPSTSSPFLFIDAFPCFVYPCIEN
ncbi:hypothetical protein M9H77_35753 [Catharanthus roseus]|uniref:Uncharacterized protein n=1 Tax=Catharanthus roseus TaxID=4058 RepID=A0ACB9ZRT4_CATRO|nr:hypothetical protein M9H77_35753 [Catharanthus roseus]